MTGNEESVQQPQGLPPERLLFILFSLAAACTLWSLLFASLLYVQYDAYYYAAAADGLVTNGRLADYTIIPPEAIRTPQNGIILLHVLLDQIGVGGSHHRMLALATLNAVLLAYSGWLVTRLCLRNGVSRLAAQLAGLSMVLSYYYYAVLLQQINDMPALFLSLAALTLLSSERSPKHWAFLLLIAWVLPVFRLSGILVFVASTLAALLLRDRRRVLQDGALTSIAVLSPILLTMLMGVDRGGIDARLGAVVNHSSLAFYLSQVWHTLILSVPEAFFRMSWFTMNFTFTSVWVGLAASVLLLALLARRTWAATRQRDHSSLTLCLSAWSLLAYFQLYHAQPTRYIILVGIVLLVVLISLPSRSETQFRLSLGYLMICLSLSLAAVGTSQLPRDAISKRTFSSQSSELLSRSPMPVFSYFPRVSWFLTGQPSHSDIASACAASAVGQILVISPKDQLVLHIGQYQQTNDKRPVQVYPLGYEYRDYRASAEPLHYFKYETVTVRSYLLRC